jgi:RNA polymerase sigma-70 factor (ECF subfamily)
MNSSLTNFSDEELAIKVLKKNREALGELFRRYHKPFFNLAYRFLGDYYLADDLTSEIFLRIYKYLKSFDRKALFKPWAYKVATNACLTFKVKSSRFPFRIGGFVGQAKLKNEDGEEEPLEFPDNKVDLVRETEKNEVAERVQRALNKLPEKYRLALYLYYFEDLKYEEIAGDLGLPLNTVRTHLKRGKEMLKKDLVDLI